MKIIGLTGGVASGKSTCSAYLVNKGYNIFDADAEVRKLYDDPEFLKKLKTIFPDVFENDILNKNLLRQNVFSNPEETKKIEQLIHPLVEQKCDEFIKKNKDKDIIFLDVPLLFESGWHKKCDEVLSILCDANIRKKRYIKRGGIPEIFDNIIKRQNTDAERSHKSSHTIMNDKELDEFYKNIDMFLTINCFRH